MGPVAFWLFGLPVYWYGVIIMTSILAGMAVAMRLSTRASVARDELLNVILLGIPLGVIGARLFFVISQWPYYSRHLDAVWRIRDGGLAIQGALFLAILGVLGYTRWRKLSFWLFADICVPGIALAQAIGRWGNFANQEAYGSVVRDLNWLPSVIRDRMFIDGQYRDPAFLYESMWDLAMMVVLLWMGRRHPAQNGRVFAWYLILYSVGRWMVEYRRVESVSWGPLHAAQVLSLIGIVVGLLILFRRQTKQLIQRFLLAGLL